jgi:hypothetical protein
MLFKGQGVARQPAMGLAWLTMAKDGASSQAKDGASSQEAWILETYRSAFVQATADERTLAARQVEEWARARRAAK